METKVNLKAPHGVAMFVVLGVILVCSLLGVFVLELAKRDNFLAGSLVNIKSQRMAAIASLNLAVGRLEERPNQAVGVINDFQADSTKRWLNFRGDSVTISSTEPDWYSLNGSDSSAVKVRILGMSSLKSTSTTVDVLLEGRGRGRNGDVFKVNAVYRIHGLNFQNYVKTNGTSNAFLAAGGIGQLQIGDTVNGPVYIGGTGTSYFAKTSYVASISKLRVEGSFRMQTNIHVTGNMIVGGALDFNNATDSLVVDSNLFVENGLTDVTGVMHVGGSFYLYGTPAFSQNGRTYVGKYFYVKDAPYIMIYGLGALRVGDSASNNGIAFMNAGMYTTNSTHTGIYGSLFTNTMTDGYTYNYANYGTYGSHLGGEFRVLGRLSYFYDNSLTGASRRAIQVVGDNANTGDTVHVFGNSRFAGPLRTGSGTRGHFTVDGATYLERGIDSVDSSFGYAPIYFNDSVYLQSNGAQSNRTGQNVIFNQGLSLHGTLSENFGRAWTSGVQWAWQRPFVWWYKYRGWTYEPQTFIVSPYSLYPLFSLTNGVERKKVENDTTPTWVADASAVKATLPTIVYDSTNTTANGFLGFTVADTTLSSTAEINQASQIDTTQFTKTDYLWSNIKNKYLSGENKGVCPEAANENLNYNAPSVTTLQCIYNNEKAKGNLWNDEYLVIHLVAGDNWGRPSGTLPSGVKILYFISPGTYGPQSWYAGEAGSYQVLISYADMTNFSLCGTYYGYIYFNCPKDFQVNYTCNMKIVGAWENASTTSKISAYGGDGLVVDYTSSIAKGVFSDIAANFSTEKSTTTGKVAIKFSGDTGSDPLTTYKQANLQDGWVQFERLGEFR